MLMNEPCNYEHINPLLISLKRIFKTRQTCRIYFNNF